MKKFISVSILSGVFLLFSASFAFGQRWNLANNQQRVPIPSSKAIIEYMGHVQGLGDVPWVTQPYMLGTVGQNRRLEGFAIQHNGASTDPIGLRYKVYLQDLGYQDWTYMPQFAGTKNEKRRMEAFWIEVVEDRDKYAVYYRAHLAGTGWTTWYHDGQMCGTMNQQRAVQAIEVMIVDK